MIKECFYINFSMIWLIWLFAANENATAASRYQKGPGYSEIAGILESQPDENSELVYWDQSVADALGIKVPPGRVGQKHFSDAVMAKIGREVKSGAKLVTDPKAFREGSDPYLYVESDAHGGAGRSGYIEVDPGVWINIKGSGVTGFGNTQGMIPQPPQNIYRSHQDGRAVGDEAIKEAFYGRLADNEFSNGGSRVLAISFKKHPFVDSDGRTVVLAKIYRPPLRRFDQKKASKSKVVDSLAEANAKRVIKGDFINESNFGAEGEFVDYGCTSFTCGYAPIISSQNELMFEEGQKSWLIEPNLYYRRLGQALVRQMGIPEKYVNATGPDQFKKMATAYSQLGHYFRDSVYFNDLPIGIDASPILLDSAHVDTEKLLGNVKFHEFFKDAAERFYRAPKIERTAMKKTETDRLISLAKKSSVGLDQNLKNFVARLHEIFEEIEIKNAIRDPLAFGAKVREVAHYQNRPLNELSRPYVIHSADALVQDYAKHHDASAIQSFIDNAAISNRFGTAPAVSSNMVVRETEHATQLYLRANQDESGVVKLFQYPELNGASTGQNMHFRVSTDKGVTFKDYESTFVKTKVGEYFQVNIPHQDLPFTWEPVELTPFIKKEGQIQWLGDHFILKGAPLVTNERIGLPSAFVRKPGRMRTAYGVKISLQPEDLVSPTGTYISVPNSIPELLSTLAVDSHSIPTELYNDVYRELEKRRGEVYELYRSDPHYREFIENLVKRENSVYKQEVTTAKLLQRVTALGLNCGIETLREFIEDPPEWE